MTSDGGGRRGKEPLKGTEEKEKEKEKEGHIGERRRRRKKIL